MVVLHQSVSHDVVVVLQQRGDALSIDRLSCRIDRWDGESPHRQVMSEFCQFHIFAVWSSLADMMHGASRWNSTVLM